jgi:hypothetical protein
LLGETFFGVLLEQVAKSVALGFGAIDEDSRDPSRIQLGAPKLQRPCG